MRSMSVRALALTLFSAILQVFCFPISGPVSPWLSALCWIALAPFLLALLQKDPDGRPLTPGQGAVLGYVCGICWYLGNCSWIYQTMYLYGGMEKPVALLILVLFSLYLGLYHALFGWLIVVLSRSSLGTRTALVLSPCVWVAVELARARVTGFPWDLLGNAQVDNLLLTHLAPLGGVMAMSLAIAAANAGIAYGAMGSRRSQRVVAGVAIGAALALQTGGAMRWHTRAVGDQTAVLVQENLAVGATAQGVRPLTLEEEMAAFRGLSLHPERVGWRTGPATEVEPGAGVAVIVWPEAPSHLHSNDAFVRSGLGELAREAKAPLVVGTLGVDLDKSLERGYSLYDSASLFDREGEYKGRYDKVHLVPWGEYVPYKHFFAFASKLTEGAGDMDPGHSRTIFHADGRAYGVFVCYESIFGDEVREFVKDGAEVLVNISDDGWYGDTGAPWQHLNMARMRAIENHRWVLRSTNTGETTTIDPEGNYTATMRHVRAAYAMPFRFEQGTTFYTRHGDWVAYLCAVVTLLGVGFGVLRR